MNIHHKFIPNLKELERLESKNIEKYRYSGNIFLVVKRNFYIDQYIFIRSNNHSLINDPTNIHTLYWHREDGPAFITVTNDKITRVGWYLENKKCNFEDWCLRSPARDEVKLKIKLMCGRLYSE